MIFLSWLDSLITSLMAKFYPPMPEAPPVSPKTAPEPTIQVPVAPSTVLASWGTQKGAWHLVRVQCDNAGLSLAEKNVICACIYQESQFYNYLPSGKPTLHENVVNGVLASTDFGICQINDYWHVKKYPDFPSSQYILDHPEKAVQFMIDAYKHGTLKQWVSYSSNAFQTWLKPDSPMWNLAK